MNRHQPKFSECRGCRYFNERIQRPQCRLCGAGEFYEPKINTRQPSDDELMRLLRSDYDE